MFVKNISALLSYNFILHYKITKSSSNIAIEIASATPRNDSVV